MALEESTNLALDGKVVSPTRPLPTEDVSNATNRETVSAETVTFVGKAAAGSRGINALDKRPILNYAGDKVGSYWGQNKNKVWRTDGKTNGDGRVDSATETAGSADVVITTTANDLELLFEDASTSRYVLRITDNTGASLYGWIGGIAESTDAYTFSIYSESGLSNQDWVGILADFDNTNIIVAEIYSYETSFVWTTGTVLTQEVNYNS